jgi:hypothetical protein
MGMALQYDARSAFLGVARLALYYFARIRFR